MADAIFAVLTFAAGWAGGMTFQYALETVKIIRESKRCG